MIEFFRVQMSRDQGEGKAGGNVRISDIQTGLRQNEAWPRSAGWGLNRVFDGEISECECSSDVAVVGVQNYAEQNQGRSGANRDSGATGQLGLGLGFRLAAGTDKNVCITVEPRAAVIEVIQAFLPVVLAWWQGTQEVTGRGDRQECLYHS
jgi:hypothetical protein